MNMNEEWRDIQGYEGLYQVSNLGRVKSLARTICMASDSKTLRPYTYRRKERVMSAGVCRGYCNIPLKKNGESQTHLIHRLVASAFIPNPNGYQEINHKDRNPLNNCVDNLEWCSRLYNVHYDGAIERQHAKISKPVCQFTMDGIPIAKYASICEASRQTGIGVNLISQAARGIFSQAKGFIWKYI